jgi:hypothetical protein
VTWPFSEFGLDLSLNSNTHRSLPSEKGSSGAKPNPIASMSCNALRSGLLWRSAAARVGFLPFPTSPWQRVASVSPGRLADDMGRELDRAAAFRNSPWRLKPSNLWYTLSTTANMRTCRSPPTLVLAAATMPSVGSKHRNFISVLATQACAPAHGMFTGGNHESQVWLLRWQSAVLHLEQR